MGKILGIAIKSTSHADMETLENAQVSMASGIIGDFRGRSPNRQITLLSAIAWMQTCNAIGQQLDWTKRRANLLIDDIEFGDKDIGRIVTIGDVELEITEETKPCDFMDEQQLGLKSALVPDWRGGACCKVLKAGSFNIGDTVTIA